MPKISLCIPYHDTPNTAFYLSRLLASVANQTFKDYEIILAREGAFARNHNATIMRAQGEFIQMLQLDDYFAHAGALGNIMLGFEKGAIWQITASRHDYGAGNYGVHDPHWTDDIYTGNNRLGSVSTLSMRREKALLFEEPLTWIVDCDLYYRLFLKYGLPFINGDYGVAIDTRPDRLSHTISPEEKEREVNYLIQKYGK